MRNTVLSLLSLVFLPSAFANLTPPRLTLEKIRPRLQEAVITEAKKQLNSQGVNDAFLHASYETVEVGKYTEDKASFMGNSKLTFAFKEDGKYQEVECDSQVTVLVRSAGSFHPRLVVLLETDKKAGKILVAYEPNVTCHLRKD